MSSSTDKVLEYVLKHHITLQDDDKKHYVKYYSLALDKLIELMKANDPLFKTIYRRVYYAGSYYDGLKVGKPEEFDLDVVMRLPVNKNDVEFISKKIKPPFTTVKCTAMDQLKHHPEWPTYRQMDNWTDKNDMLLQGPFRRWLESVITTTLLTLPQERGQSNGKRLDINGEKYVVSFRKTGPAMTFNITIPDGTKIDVDFVPVLEFKYPNNWPPHPVRQNPIPSRDTWFIVPKPNSKNASEYNETYWRLAFHDQEREMINGKQRLKPVCRLLKKLRDNTGMKSISSYYIKTLFLWDIHARSKSDPTYWAKATLTTYFMSMLKMLHEKLKQGRINYFWDERYDLLSGMSDDEKFNCAGRLSRIIKEIESKSNDDPKIIAKYILTPEEFKVLEDHQAEFSRSSPVVSEKENQLPTKGAKTPITNDKAIIASGANTGSSMESVMQLLTSMQQEIVQQRKVTQTVLAKVNILQSTVDRLTEDNALLRDELKLATKHAKNFRDNAIDLLTPCDLVHENQCAIAPLINLRLN